MAKVKAQRSTGEAKAKAREAVLGSAAVPQMQEKATAAPKAPVLAAVTMSLPSAKNVATHRPDLLGHPFHEYLDKQGLEGFFAAKDMLDFHGTRGFRIFRRPAGMRDEHSIFHGTDGDTVQRGDLVLMVRSKVLGASEAQVNAAAYAEEVAGLQDDMKQKMPKLGTKTTGEMLRTQAAEFSEVKPTDGEQEEE